MKARAVLYVVAILGLLLPVGVVPVQAAEGDLAMWVHQLSITYTGRAPKGPDAIVAFVHVRDENLNKVVGAAASAIWTLPDGATYVQEGIETNLQGIAEFSVFDGAGDYTLCVTDVVKVGWEYQPERNRATCATFILPPYAP